MVDDLQFSVTVQIVSRPVEHSLDWASPSADSVGDRKPKTTIVTFSYNSRVYTLKFIDEGMLDWATDDWQGGPPLRRGLASA